MKRSILLFVLCSLTIFSLGQIPNIGLKDVNGDLQNLSKICKLYYVN